MLSMRDVIIKMEKELNGRKQPTKRAVLEGLACCAIGTKESEVCLNCPYTYVSEKQGDDECQELFFDAYALLSAPHVMTIEEIEDSLDNVIWFEVPKCENTAKRFALITAYSHLHGFVNIELWGGFTLEVPYQDLFGRKPKCRIWSGRPTDGQRKAIPWS